MKMIFSLHLLLATCSAATLTACGGGDSGNPLVAAFTIPVAEKYAVGGTISGLSGSVTGPQVVLSNGGDTQAIWTNGPFSFHTWQQSGSTYEAVVATQPVGYQCQLQNGKGTVGKAAVTTILVTCAATG